MTSEPVDEKAAYNIARRIESPQARADYLEQACGENPQVMQRVAELLRMHDEQQSFLEAPPHALGACLTLDQPITEKPGAQIGPYKLVEEIGEGGMGVVYLAKQLQPVRRKVALKIIKPGMDSKQVVSRFEAERQALAMMDHPSIARVFDGGSTESGRPYFVMELVNGMPVTDYCDRYRFTTDQRLELFIQICQAVQHAHQKGIIHRDLKPSNILVTHLDGRAVPKVIDFGVAKAISGQLTDRSTVTHFSQMIGTPLYMSPEQAELSGQDIDTRSDVYSLGVLLYELLTGATPFDRQRLKEASPDEFRRIIQEEEPPRPSARLSTLEAALDTVAEKHQTDPRTLSRRLSGELDWIVMRALEKDRNRRYESASAFGADIERYLNDEPVAACPPSISYQFRKFARRNRVALTTSAVVAVAVLVGTGVSIWQAHRATNEARRATAAEQLASRRLEQVDEQRRLAEDNYNEAETQRQRAEANVQLALDTLDQVSLPLAEMAFAGKIELDERDRQILEKTLPFYETLAAQKADDPEAQLARAQAYLRVGNIYRTLRVHPDEKDEKAGNALRRAIALFEELTAQPSDRWLYHRHLAISYRDLGNLLSERQPEEAEQAYRRSIEVYENVFAVYENVLDDLPREHRDGLPHVQCILGSRLASRWGRPEEAVQLFLKSLIYYKKLLGESPDSRVRREQVANGLSALGDACHRAGQTRQAEDYLSEAIDCCDQWATEFPNEPCYPCTLGGALRNLARLLKDSDRLDEAEQTFVHSRDVLENLVERWPGPTGYRNLLGAGTLPDLATLLESRGRFDEAETAWRRALVLNEQLAVELPYSRHPQFANEYRMNLIRVLMELGQDEEAEKVISKAYPDPGTAEELAQRAELYETAHLYDKALADYEKAIKLDPEASDAYVGRGSLYLTLKQYDKALADSEKAIELDPDNAYRLPMGAILKAAGHLEEAQEFSRPMGIMFGPDGSLYVSSRAMRSVLRYDATSGAFAGEFATGGGLRSPHGLASGPDGNLYVSSEYTRCILRYDGATGLFIDVFVPDVAHPVGLVFGPDGNLYVSSFGTHAIVRYDGSTGAFIDTFVASGAGGLFRPTGLVFGPEGDLYVSSQSTNRVLRFEGGTGAVAGVFASRGGLNAPIYLAFGPDGNLYVSGRVAGAVFRYDGKTGAFIDIFASGHGLNNPLGLAFGPDGNLYVTTTLPFGILRFDGKTGTFIDRFTRAGSEAIDGSVEPGGEPAPEGN